MNRDQHKNKASTQASTKTSDKAYTLLELLIVMAMASIVAGLTIIAINPGRQIAQARNTHRASDIRTIHSAIRQYHIENVAWPSSELSSNLKEVCDENNLPAGCLDLSILIPAYIPTMPKDPLVTVGTGYEVLLDLYSQAITVVAPLSTENNHELLTVGGSGCNNECFVALRSGLLGYWPLDNNATDFSGQSRDGTITGASPIDGKLGGAYSFDGDDDISFSTSGLPYGDAARTTCLWTRINNLNATSNYRWALAYGDNSSLAGNNWFIGTSGNSGNFLFGGAGLSDGHTKTIPNIFKEGRWTNVCTSYDGTTITAYVNANKLFTDEHAYSTFQGTAYIGRHGPSGQPEHWIGDIDEVSIWNRKLSDLEIRHVFNGGKGLNLRQN